MSHTPVPEAPLVQTDAGKKPDGDGWFVVNLAEAMAIASPDAGRAFVFEPERGAFPHLGINVRVLQPGQPASMYHAEAGQEAFLVLEGECLLVVEDRERRLGQWDFVHLPPHTAHVVVGAGDRPCAVLMAGARHAGDDVVYPVSEAAARHGASVDRETSSPPEAYAGWQMPVPERCTWPPARDSGA